jgi:hypothetical protein
MTCRGSRFADGAKRNPDGQVFMKNRETDEWLKQNQKSTREFLRKWGHFCKHDALMKPIIPPKYDVGFIIKNCNDQLLAALEPWCSNIYVDEGNIPSMIDNYITLESPNTSFDLYERIRTFDDEKNNYILVEIDGNNFNQNDLNYIQNVSAIINDSGEVGTFELGNLSITINSLQTFENELIICE